MDLAIRGGTVATAGGAGRADIGVEGGKIAILCRPGDGESLRGATRALDATGLIVTPGGVDPHVHLTPPTRGASAWSWVDDFDSGTAAALAGGVTSVGNISFPEQGQTLADAVRADTAAASPLARADYFLHPVLMEPDERNLAEIEGLHREGHTSIKIFLSFHRFDRHVGAYLEAMRRTAAAGGITLVHCEDAAIIECCCNLLRETGRTAPRYYPEARPVHAEAVATTRTVAFSETTGCPVYVVHLASARALDACLDGRARGVPVYVETRPLYLHLTRERFDDPDGAKYAGAPPLRDAADVERLWNALRFGDVDTLATDHAPWMLADKLDPAQTAMELRQGVADLETCLPMLFSEGVRTGRVSLEQFVAVTSTNPAKLFGLYPRKGTIAVGGDADLVLWNPEETRTIDGAAMHSRADFSPYDGREITGWPVLTISRGEIVAEDGAVLARPGRGELLKRGPHRGL
jgi:dihydropyrimidinase